MNCKAIKYSTGVKQSSLAASLSWCRGLRLTLQLASSVPCHYRLPRLASGHQMPPQPMATHLQVKVQHRVIEHNLSSRRMNRFVVSEGIVFPHFAQSGAILSKTGPRSHIDRALFQHYALTNCMLCFGMQWKDTADLLILPYHYIIPILIEQLLKIRGSPMQCVLCSEVPLQMSL